VSAHREDELPPSRTAIRAALDDYLLAHDCWQKKLENRFAFVDSGSIDSSSRFLTAGDPLHSRLSQQFPALKKGGAIDLDTAIQEAWRSANLRLSPAREALARSTVLSTGVAR
jgi:hypothetical protein